MPYERVILGPRYTLRVEDLQATDAVEIECACGRKGLVAPHRLHDRFHGSERLVHVASLMRCPHCERRGTMHWLVVRASPPRS